MICFLMCFSLIGSYTPWSMKLCLSTVDSVHLEQHPFGKEESISLLTPPPLVLGAVPGTCEKSMHHYD